MVTLKVFEEKDYNKFTLVDNENNYYSFFLEFKGIKKPKVGSYFKIDENLLNPNYEEYSNLYAFEQTQNNDACAIIVKEDKEIMLRRIYG